MRLQEQKERKQRIKEKEAQELEQHRLRMLEIQIKTSQSQLQPSIIEPGGGTTTPGGTAVLPPIAEKGVRSASWNPRLAGGGMGGRLLYKEWEENYKARVEAETLEERKKKLEEIRSMKKPMTKEEIEEHARRYEEMREEHRLKKMEELEIKREKEDQEVMVKEKLKTRAYEKVARYDERER